MLSIVLVAMFSKASRVKNAWWPVMITLGKVSSRREYVVAKDQPGAVFEKDLFFLLVNIEAEIANFATLQRFDNRDGVKQRAATGVDRA